MFETTPIPDLLIVRPKRFGDNRGFFSEVWNRQAFEERGLSYNWCQDNHSRSAAVGTLRGLHYQKPPKAQAKLVRCPRGRVWDVVADVRPKSPTYGKWFGLELSDENWTQLLVPRGFLHGFVTLEPDSELLYKVDNPYSSEDDGAVRWDDPDLGIDWPFEGEPILSDKDRKAPRLSEWTNPFEDGT